MQERGIIRLLDVGDERLLAAIEPDEIGREAVHGFVVAAREIAFGALDLDDARPGVGEPRRTIGRGHRLFEGHDEDAVERLA